MNSKLEFFQIFPDDGSIFRADSNNHLNISRQSKVGGEGPLPPQHMGLFSSFVVPNIILGRAGAVAPAGNRLGSEIKKCLECGVGFVDSREQGVQR